MIFFISCDFYGFWKKTLNIEFLGLCGTYKGTMLARLFSIVLKLMGASCSIKSGALVFYTRTIVRVHPTTRTSSGAPYNTYQFGCTLQHVPFWVHPTTRTILGAPYNTYHFGCTLQHVPFWVHPTTRTILGAPYNT